MSHWTMIPVSYSLLECVHLNINNRGNWGLPKDYNMKTDGPHRLNLTLIQSFSSLPQFFLPYPHLDARCSAVSPLVLVALIDTLWEGLVEYSKAFTHWKERNGTFTKNSLTNLKHGKHLSSIQKLRKNKCN